MMVVEVHELKVDVTSKPFISDRRLSAYLNDTTELIAAGRVFPRNHLYWTICILLYDIVMEFSLVA